MATKTKKRSKQSFIPGTEPPSIPELDTASEAAKTRKRSKQSFIPGTEPPSIPELDTASEAYYDLKRERSKLSREEADAMFDLAEKMKENGVDTYETPDGLIVRAVSRTKCTVKRKVDTNTSD